MITSDLKFRLVMAAVALSAGALLASAPSFGTEQGQQRQQARDTRQDTRQQSRDDKVDCRKEDNKNNAQCRQDHRDNKREGRKDARDIKY